MENKNNIQTLDEWELSKENVLPLKQGRKMTNLTAALQPQNIDRQQQLILQRQGFETELRAYTGDDPLDPWIRYIQWTEQNFPQGGKDSHLSTLMQKCLIQFKKDEQYKQDPRFVSIWLKMAQYDNESLEIFKFMRANQIGSQLTMFYESWAHELEQAGNTKMADAIYKEGLACNAQPRDKLERAMIEFQSRVGRATMQQLQEGMLNPPPSSSEENRATLGDLRARGKHQKVGTNRTGAAKLSGRGGLQVASAPLQQVGNQISIFCDDDAPSAARQPETASEWKHLTSSSEAQKENSQSAGQWAGQRLPQRNVPRMTFQEAGAFTRPEFAVHVDENVQQITTPHKPVEMGFQVLSERKVSKPANALQHIKQDNTNDNTKVMYCKHLIYGGAREMSFEELRAIKDKTKRKERELQAKMEAVQQREAEILRKQSQQQEMFAMFQQELVQQRLQHQQLIDMLVKQKQQEAAVPQPAPQTTLQAAPQPTPQPALQPTPQPALQPLALLPAAAQPALPMETLQTHTAPVPALPTQFAPAQQAVFPSQRHLSSAMPSEQRELPLPSNPQPQARDEGHTGQSKPGVGIQMDHTTQAEQEVARIEGPVAAMPHGSFLDGNVTKERHRSHSGDTTTGCTKHLAFDDLTGATGNFNIFCDPAENLPAKPSARYPPSSTAINPPHKSAPFPQSAPSASSTMKPPSSAPLAGGGGVEQDIITPNQSLNLNASSTNPNSTGVSDNKTPQTSCLSDKTPSSASFTASSAQRGARMGRLSNIRTPKGLTAPSPTINTREAMGVINAMLNSSLESSLFGWDNPQAPQIPSQEKDFEMEFAQTDQSEKQPQKGFIFEDHGAFARVGGFGGTQGIIPRRQPLAMRPGIPSDCPQREAPVLPPSSSSSVSIYQDNIGASTTSEDKIKIYEEQPIDDTKENTPPSDYKQISERREMMGVLQCSKGIPFMPLEDDVPEIEKGMEVDALEVQPNVDPLASSQHRDLSHTMNITLPPSAAGNHSFDVAARMASTPFNDASDRKLSFIPPMSTIKPTGVTQAPGMVPGSVGQGRVLPLEQRFAANVGAGAGMVGKMNAGDCLASRITQPVNESFEKTEYTVNHSGGPLSPIMETSAENARSSASSSNSHSSGSSLEGSHAPTSTAASGLHASLAPAPASVLGFNIHVDADDVSRPPSKLPGERPAQPAAHSSSGFSIHIDNDQGHLQSRERDSLHTDRVAMPMAASAPGFIIHEDAKPHAPLAAPSHRVEPTPSMEAVSQSIHDMSLSTGLPQAESTRSQMHHSRLDAPADAETSTFLQKDDLPALEMSFIPDRTLTDTTAVEQELTTFGMGDEPLDYSDPFNAGLQNLLLTGLSKPLTMHKGFYQHDQEMMPAIKPGLAVNFGDEVSVYNVIKKVGEGAFATIYLANCLDAQDITDLDCEDRKVVLKVQHPPCPWEFYIIRELHARLSKLPSQVDVRPCLMSAECAHMFEDKSCLVTEYHPSGTLLDLINLKKAASIKDIEQWEIHLTIEILQMVELMHRCHIIHGDIKPDNFLLTMGEEDDNMTCSLASGNLLKLIDMGRSIDVSLFPAGTVFTSKCNTSGFNCIEMQTNQPWTYQVDYYGIAGTVYCLMFGKYMKVFKEGGIWRMASKIPRTSKVNWKHFFHTLLNVASCDPSDLPNLGDLRRDLEKHVSMSKGEMRMDLEALLLDRD